MENLPQDRAEWSKLSWNDAQRAVGRLLNHNGFMKFDEYRLGNGRADLVVINKDPKYATIGIIEVKCYNRVTPKLQRSAKIQAAKYLSKLFIDHQSNHYWQNKKIKYFIMTVFTNDYPVKEIKLSVKERRTHLPPELVDIIILSSTPGRIIERLTKYKLLPRISGDLHDYFD